MLGAVAISVFFLFFTNYLVGELSSKELAEVNKVAKAFEQLNNPDQNLNLEEVRKTLHDANIPILVVDEKGFVFNFKNLDSAKVYPKGNKRIADSSYFHSQLRLMKFFNNPIPI